MKNLFLAMILSVFLVGCSAKKEIPEVAFTGTQVEDLVDKPDRQLMSSPPPKKKLEKGMDNGQAIVVISDNNLRAADIENRLEGLQQYVCNLFKDPVGEVCKKR